MNQKIYTKILQGGIYASFLIFLLFNTSWLYPYTTYKQLIFNILIEALAVVWLVLIVKYPTARPKKSWLTWSILAWLGLLLLTCFLGVDFNLSFWSDANRMLGWFHLAHFFIFYLILITVFKTKADWQRLFNLSLVTAALMVLYSLLKSPSTADDSIGSTVNMGNNISTLGNATHVAGVMLFCFYFAVYSFLQKKEFYQKILYALAGVIVLVGFFYADVSGSQAGLAVSLVVFGLLYTFLAATKKTRKISLISIVAFIVIIAAIFTFRNAPIFNNRFGKIFRDFSLQNTNLDTRLYAWRAGWNGFKEKPILGWGYGNFAVVYDKFFDGSYYHYTMQEEYFDRAHNNLIDLGVTTGAVGLAVYLIIFACVFYCLIKGYRQKKFGWPELSIALAIMIAYFIHNLAVFDFWGTYFMFFLVLAWIFSLSQGQASVESGTGRIGLNDKELITWVVAGAGALFLIFNYNLAFAKMFRGTIKLTDLLRTEPQGQDLVAYYRQPFSAHTPMDRSGIDTVSDFVANTPDMLKNLSQTEKRDFFDYFIDLNKQTVALNPDNSLGQARLARTLMTACLNLNDKNYCQQVFDPAEKSMATGGQHIPVYRVKSIAQLYLNDVDGAIATLKQALAFYDQYTEVNCQLARTYIVLKNNNDTDKATGQAYLKKCLEEGGGKDFATDPAMSEETKTVQKTIDAEKANQAFEAKSGQYTAYLAEGLKYKSEGDAGNRDSYYKAIESYKQAVAVSDQKVWIPYLNLGNVYRIIGDYSQSETNYNKALEISGGDSIIFLAKIELYQLYMKKPATEVKALYQEALKTTNGNANLMINYAGFCRDNGYTEDAINAYKSLIKSFPDKASIYQAEIDRLKK